MSSLRFERDDAYREERGTTLTQPNIEGTKSGRERKVESGEFGQLRRRHRRLAVALIVIFLLGAVALATGDPGAELLFVLAVAPSSYIFWHFHHADKYKREPVRFLLGTFALGGLLSLAAGLIESTYSPFDPNAGLVATFLYFLFGVGLVEESMKFISVRIYSYRSSHFDEAMDGVVLGISAALGFATVENVVYVFTNGVATAFFRAFVSVPGHAFWGAIVGYYLGEAKVRHQPSLALRGLVIAVFFHGLFDTLALEIPDPLVGLMVLAGLVWIIYFGIVKKEIAKAQSESPYLPSGKTLVKHAPWVSENRGATFFLALMFESADSGLDPLSGSTRRCS